MTEFSRRVEQTPSLYQACKAAGFRLDSHESDLYVEASAASLELLTEHGASFSPFTDTEGRCWYDVPFAFDPFWVKKAEAR